MTHASDYYRGDTDRPAEAIGFLNLNSISGQSDLSKVSMKSEPNHVSMLPRVELINADDSKADAFKGQPQVKPSEAPTTVRPGVPTPVIKPGETVKPGDGPPIVKPSEAPTTIKDSPLPGKPGGDDKAALKDVDLNTIEKHILDLDDPATRAAAQKQLESIGTPALPALEKALKLTVDPEAKRRLDSSIEAIKQIEFNRSLLKTAKENETAIDSFLHKGGLSFSYGATTAIRQDGTALEGVVNVVHGSPRADLTDADRRSAEALIELGDKIWQDPRFEKDAWKGRSTQPDDVLSVSKLRTVAEDSRLLYASSLAVSDQPLDHKRALELLKEDVGRFLKSPEDFASVASRIDADKNPALRHALKAAGGDLKKLDEISDRYRRSRR